MNHRSTELALMLATALLWSGAVQSEQAVSRSELPPPSAGTGDEELEPEVNIIQHEDKTIEEYRMHGQIYKIKVTPKNAPPYYLIDTDGDGLMDARRTEIEPELMIPRWVLFRW